MSEGIGLVKIIVHKDDFDRLHSLMLYLFECPEEIGDWKAVRKEYGELRWTSGYSLRTDDWVTVLIDRYDFTQISHYGEYMSKVWDENGKTKTSG